MAQRCNVAKSHGRDGPENLRFNTRFGPVSCPGFIAKEKNKPHLRLAAEDCAEAGASDL
jgi:hypothetical protein